MTFIHTSLFSLEKVTRLLVMLGLVGAGGLSIELKAAMKIFRYDQAVTTSLMIFALLIGAEHVSAAVRRRAI